MAEPSFTIVKPVEYLGLWTATVDEQPAVVFSVRLNTDSFSVTNLSLTASQAKRLAIDLVSALQIPNCLKAASQIRSFVKRLIG